MSSLNELFNLIKSHKKVLLMFDYDGTLTPIVERPNLAVLDENTRNMLEIISKQNFLKVSIISGRSVNNLLELSGLNSKEITVYGIHGGEYWGTNNEITYSAPVSYMNKIDNLYNDVSYLENLPGIVLENKKYSISIHFRLADKETAKQAIKEFKSIVKSQKLIGDFKLLEGKKVIEILPSGFNKGNAVSYLVDKYKDYFPVYFGDDKTDISAFLMVKDLGGKAIQVGRDNIKIYDEKVTINDLKHFLKNVYDSIISI